MPAKFTQAIAFMQYCPAVKIAFFSCGLDIQSFSGENKVSTGYAHFHDKHYFSSAKESWPGVSLFQTGVNASPNPKLELQVTEKL